MKRFEESVSETFSLKKWRLTSGTRNICRVLESTKKPLSAKEISEGLDQIERSVDMTTIYRILDRFVSVGLVHLLDGKFIRCSDPGNAHEEHHFLVCRECASAEEIFLDYRDSISGQLRKEKGFTLEEVELSFHGLCKGCKH